MSREFRWIPTAYHGGVEIGLSDKVFDGQRATKNLAMSSLSTVRQRSNEPLSFLLSS